MNLILLSTATNHVLIVCVWIMSGVDAKQKITVKVVHDARPEDVIGEAIRKKTRSMHLTPEHQQMCISEHQESYLLKICGIKQYLIGSHPMCQFRVSSSLTMAQFIWPLYITYAEPVWRNGRA